MSQAPRTDKDAARSRTGSLYREHLAWLLRYLTSRFGRQRAEDLAQDAFLSITASSPDEVRHPKAFLKRVALNAAVNQHRNQLSQKRGQLALSLDLMDEEVGSSPDQEEALLYRQILLSMPPRLRETFLLNRVAGLSYDRIAEKLGISVKTVEKRMSQALVHCTTKLRG